jgi:hypothetical protein
MAARIEQHGPVSAGAEYLGKQNGDWVARSAALYRRPARAST